MNTDIFSPLETWFVIGSQHLYGPEALEQVRANGGVIADALNNSCTLPVKVVYKPIVTTPEEVTKVCLAANSAPNCIGLIFWMHTFSPAKMWIAGLQALQKPFAILLKNSGLNADEWLTQVKSAKTGYGIDVTNPTKLVDMKAAGVIDPVRVTREALMNAVSIAGTTMTMGALVVENPKKEDSSSLAPGMGMY